MRSRTARWHSNIHDIDLDKVALLSRDGVVDGFDQDVTQRVVDRIRERTLVALVRSTLMHGDISAFNEYFQPDSDEFIDENAYEKPTIDGFFKVNVRELANQIGYNDEHYIKTLEEQVKGLQSTIIQCELVKLIQKDPIPVKKTSKATTTRRKQQPSQDLTNKLSVLLQKLEIMRNEQEEEAEPPKPKRTPRKKKIEE